VAPAEAALLHAEVAEGEVVAQRVLAVEPPERGRDLARAFEVGRQRAP